MPANGRVTKLDDGSYSNHLATRSIRKNIELLPNNKTADHQPDFIVMANNVETGATWISIGQASDNVTSLKCVRKLSGTFPFLFFDPNIIGAASLTTASTFPLSSGAAELFGCAL